MLKLNLIPLAAASNSTFSSIYSIGMIVLVFVVFYFFLIRPQRKKDKDAQKMRNSVDVGDEITTIGGIVGRIVSIKDDIITIETGADRNKMRIRKWAIQSCDSVHENAE